MKNIYLLSVCTITRIFEDYRNEYPLYSEEREKETVKVFCGDSWIETLENTIKDLNDVLAKKGLSIDSPENELIKAIIEHDLSENILTKAFETKEEAEAELVRIKKEAAAACQGYTLVHSHGDFEKYIHNDFLDVVFNNIRFSPYRGYWRMIYCYDAQTGIELGSIPDNEKWDVWFNKIKNINSETFKEVVSMIEEPGPCLGD